MNKGTLPDSQGLYNPKNEHDSCGVGFVANIKGQQSHTIIQQGLDILRNLTHRGAVGADPLAGDGAGILIQIPDAFIRAECQQLAINLPALGQYGVGMLFFPREEETCKIAMQKVADYIAAEGQTLLGWRDVPTDNTALG